MSYGYVFFKIAKRLNTVLCIQEYMCPIWHGACAVHAGMYVPYTAWSMCCTCRNVWAPYSMEHVLIMQKYMCPIRHGACVMHAGIYVTYMAWSFCYVSLMPRQKECINQFGGISGILVWSYSKWHSYVLQFCWCSRWQKAFLASLLVTRRTAFRVIVNVWCSVLCHLWSLSTWELLL